MNITYKLFRHQKEILSSKDPILYARCGRGSGKSFIASLLAVLAMIKGERVICLGQTSQSIREVLVPEMLARLNEIIPGQFIYNKTSNKITYKKGIIYLGSYESLESIRGYTKISLAVCDEVALAPPDLFTVLAFTMRDSGRPNRIRMMSTPRPANWVTALVKEKNIPVITAKTSDNKRITAEEIELMRATCPDENTWQREFYGIECDDNSSGTIFTRDMFAINVWNKNEIYSIGIDCAGLGNDSWCICTRQGNRIEFWQKKVATEKEIVLQVDSIMRRLGEKNLAFIAVDSAYGLGVVERLQEKNLPVINVPFGSSADKSDTYANKRAEIYFKLQKYLSNEGMCKIDDDTINELMATKYILNNSNKIQLIKKDDIKLVIGKSPDHADSLALTFTNELVNNGNLVQRNREMSRKLFD